MGGRGCGKTRSGAEWIREQVRYAGCKRIALVAPTLQDAREVMLEGASGLLHIGYPTERPEFLPSRRMVKWPNGAVGHIFSAEDPDSLRGPQFDAAWCDEFCAWAHPADTLSNLRLALRLGQGSRMVITTTPRPIPALRALMEMPNTVVTHAKTSDNSLHLSAAFMQAVKNIYGGTALGRQELGGELIEDFEGALWPRDLIDRARVETAPPLSKIIISIDPPTTSGPKSDRCGLIVAGQSGQGREACAYILQDASVQGYSPEAWARRAIDLFYKWDADCLLAETNQGGEMIRAIIGQIDPDIPLRTVHASRSKSARAMPVAALYEQGRVKHAGCFDALEDEMALFGTPAQKHSPDRTDALVWAVHHLLLGQRSMPRIRVL